MSRKTRFAPSPTGFLHVGNLRTAVFNYLIAKKNQGEFILRFDDTDSVRSKVEYMDQIKRDLEWLGLHWNRIEKQSSRIAIYEENAEKLRNLGLLYECFETPQELDLKRKKQLNRGKPPVYDRSALKLTDAKKEILRSERKSHWRYKLDGNRTEWYDGILGDISIDSSSISDPVLIRNDGQFLYTLASVSDDLEFEISNVVRGSDHVTNTATQIQIIKSLGGELCEFSHHSLLVGSKGEPLSKRLGTLAIKDLKEMGIEARALIFYLSSLGTSTYSNENSTLQEIIKTFDLSNFGLGATKFDHKSLESLSSKILSNSSFSVVHQDIELLGVPETKAALFWEMARENITTRSDLKVLWKLCSEGAEPLVSSENYDFVKKSMEIMPPSPRNELSWQEWIREIKSSTDRRGKDIFMPLRKALTGQDSGPDMSKLFPLLQKIKIVK